MMRTPTRPENAPMLEDRRETPSWARTFGLPSLLAVAFVGVASLLIGRIQGEDGRRQRAAMEDGGKAVGQSLVRILTDDESYLEALAAEWSRDSLTDAAFQFRASRFVANHPELLNLTRVDAALTIRDAAPREPNAQILGLKLTLPEPLKAATAARESRRPRRTRPFTAIQGNPSLEIWVPVYRGDAFIGLIAGVVSVERLLGAALPPSLARLQRFELRGDGGDLLAESTSTLSPRPGLRQKVDLPMPGLALYTESLVPDRVRAGTVLLLVLCIGLAAAIGWALWLTRRDVARRKTAGRKLLRMAQLYSALSQVNQAIIRSRSQDELLKRICKAMVEFGQLRMAWIGRQDPEQRRVEIICEEGDADRYTEFLDIRTDTSSWGEEPAGHAIKDETYFIANDFLGASANLPWHDAAAARGFRSAAAFPIRQGGGIWGVLMVYSSELNVFGEPEIGLLCEAAANVSFALDHIAGEAQRVRAEEALRVNEERLRNALEGASDGIWDVDMISGQVYLSPRGCQILGYQEEELPHIARVWNELVHPEDLPETNLALSNYLGGKRDLFQVEQRLRTKEGTWKWVLARGKVTRRDGLGHPLRMTGTHTDLTERKEMEAEHRRMELELQHAQKLDSLGALAGGVAHDMNNVLTAILSLAETLRFSFPEAGAQALATIIQATERGKGLVKSLTDFARKDLPDARLLDLNELVRQEEAILLRTLRQKVQIQVALEEGLPRILGETGMLGSAIMNLCINARDAMPEGGTITLRTHRSPDGVELVVEDTGRGMAPEVLARATEPFFTTKPAGKGTGLGLAMVYSTLKAHGGNLAIWSVPGKGTRVVLRFPPAPEAALGGPAPLPQAGASTRTPRKLLLVDDDELIQSSVPAALSNLGHVVHSATTGSHALELLAGGLKVDVVILDYNMPGMNGAETLDRIMGLDRGIPVIIATGFVDAELSAALARWPKVLSLPKPFTSEALQLAIDGLA